MLIEQLLPFQTITSFMTYTHQTKVGIIGGGPAGSVTSLFLSKHKIPHILVDRKQFPRDKVCGESFDGRVVHILNELSPSYLNEMEEKGIIVKSWKYSVSTAKDSVDIDFPTHNTPRILTQRLHFDNYLIQEAKKSPYAQIIEGEYINETVYTDNHIILKSKNIAIQAEIGIVAAGAFSKLSQHKGLDDDIYLIERTYYKNIPSIGNKVEIYFLRKPIKGYLYVCPAGGELFNVSLYTHKKEFKKQKQKMSVSLQDALNVYPEVKKRIEQAEVVVKPKGTYISFREKKINSIAGNRLINVGSSAFSINTITGAGVGNAMTMAKIISEEIATHQNDVDFVKKVSQNYQTRANKKLKSLVKTSIALNFFMNNMKLFEPFLGALSKTKSFQRAMHQSNLVSNVTNFKYHIKNFYYTYFQKKEG